MVLARLREPRDRPQNNIREVSISTTRSQLLRAVDHAMAEVGRVGDPEKLPLPVKTVLLVHAAQGLIDNGGLQYFFESDFPGKLSYAVFVKAYRAIGAAEESIALASAVKLFPFADPHLNQPRRDKFLGQFQHGGGHRTDSPFEPYDKQLCGNKAVWRLLAAYIAKHAAAFPS